MGSPDGDDLELCPPRCFGVAAFGQLSVQRVVKLLHAEMTVAVGMSGFLKGSSFGRSLGERNP